MQVAASKFQSSSKDSAIEHLYSSVPLRPPASVCNLERMGAAFPTRLSFMRILLRRMSNEGWHLGRGHFDLDDEGFGTAVYLSLIHI